MRLSTNYGLILILVVAALSLVAGLLVVVITGPESIRLASAQQASQATATAQASPTSAADVAPAAPTDTATLPPPTATFTSTPALAETATPEPTPSATATYFPTLAPDAVAIGRLVTDNNSTARLRSVPGLEGKVISAVQPGEYVQILGGQTSADEIDWLPVRLNSGLSGWIAANLIETFP